MTDVRMTPRQAQQAQVDEWRDRHDFHYRQTPDSLAAATEAAIEADHTDALEMNANGDAGRAAFLGLDAPVAPVYIPAATRVQRAAALHAVAHFLADSPDHPMPTDVRLYTHDLTLTQLRALADLHGVRVYHSGFTAHIEIPLTHPSLAGVTIEHVLFCRDTEGPTPAAAE